MIKIVKGCVTTTKALWNDTLLNEALTMENAQEYKKNKLKIYNKTII